MVGGAVRSLPRRLYVGSRRFAAGDASFARFSFQLGSENFRPLSDAELSGRSDDRLLDYIRWARESGAPAEAKKALKLLVVRNIADVQRRVRMKVPRDDIEDVTQIALTSAIASAFTGESVGEFHAWLNTIVHRRIVDYHRGHETDCGRALLLDEHEGDEETWGHRPESREPDAHEIELRLEVARLIEDLKESHQVVVVLYCYMERAAAEVAAEVNQRFTGRLDDPMTESNVQQIGSRFRKRLRDVLDADETSP